MPLANQEEYHFAPTGVVDNTNLTATATNGFVVDSSQVREGGCAVLQNLVPDFTGKNCFVPRLAVQNFGGATFGGLTSPTFCSVFYIFGDIVYGMVTTTDFPGFDHPFAYNIALGTPITVTGVVAGNVPSAADPNITHDWTPPTMALIGNLLLVTHPGFPNGANKFGWFDVSTPTAPVWHAGDLGGNALPAGAPVAVENFNGRAWFLCNPANAQPSAIFSDVLNATQRTNGNQAITLDDYSPLTALQGLQLQNQLGGVIQSLIIFKGTQGIYQITGDYSSTSSPLTKNLLQSNMGTRAPNAVMNVPDGLLFLNHDGFRLIDFYGKIGPPIGANGDGICASFMYATPQSRVVAATNAHMFRATSITPAGVISEWWYDMTRQIWTGPHTTAPSFVLPYKDTFIILNQNGNVSTFYLAPFKPVIGTPQPSYLEYGNVLQWTYRTPNLPNPQHMNAYQVNEAYILAGNFGVINVQVFDEFNTPLLNINAAIQATQPQSYTIPFPMRPLLVPLYDFQGTQGICIGSRLSFQFGGISSNFFEIADLWIRLQNTGYMQGTLDN